MTALRKRVAKLVEHLGIAREDWERTGFDAVLRVPLKPSPYRPNAVEYDLNSVEIVVAETRERSIFPKASPETR